MLSPRFYMLFNSYVFVLAFLPIALLGFFLIGRQWGKRAALSFLIFASLFFYGWWNPPYLVVILASIAFNYTIGRFQRRRLVKHGAGSKLILAGGVVTNLALLGYFKYANFFVNSANAVFGTVARLEPVFLPLAISFFTFTQIAYLVDAYENTTCDYSLLDYCFFVLFFPHLIAGPIVRHHEILPQVAASKGRLLLSNFSIGITVFTFGLFKKVVLADGVGESATTMFASVDAGSAPNWIAAWGGVLAYTCQLYFDFSGYSDMAIGLGALFGIRMPLNFNSPYKASSIIEFWRRWHISLSRFLRDYLYIRMGGKRKGTVRRYANLMTTMLLGGLWHGAGWTFVLWGGLHGTYLLINHAWARVTKGQAWACSVPIRVFYHVITFLAVVVGWVFFRAKSFPSAVTILKGMAGLNGIVLPKILEWSASALASPLGITFGKSGLGTSAVIWVAVLLPVVFFMPNTQQIMYQSHPALEQAEAASAISWAPSAKWAVVTGILLSIAVLSMGRVSEFLYFQF
jgi:alginate O-acetyltransferase complex protein AlgI